MKNFSSITVNGKAFSDYVISGSLYNVNACERISDLAAKIEQATGLKLPVVDAERLPEHNGGYIFLSDTNIDFSCYEIKLENGNITLFANYYTLDACINSFFSDMLGYNLHEGIITGSDAVNMTKGRVYSIEKSKIYSKKRLFNVLKAVYDDDSKVIIGQQMNRNVSVGEVFNWEVNNYKEGCGTEAALYGYDIGSMLVQSSYNDSAKVKFAYEMIEYMRSGGMITLSVHFPNPTTDNPHPGKPAAGILGDGTVETWTSFMDDPDNIMRARYLGYLEQIADFLEIFHKNDAPIILRPFLEMNVSSAWWCMKNKGLEGKATYFVYNPNSDPKYDGRKRNLVGELWREMYDYLVNGVDIGKLKGRKYDNMLWEYAPNVLAGHLDYALGVMDCYPGDDYVDLAAMDFYTDVTCESDDRETGYGDGTHLDRLQSQYAQITNGTKTDDGSGKLFSFAEHGPGKTRRIGDSGSYTTESLNRFIKTCVKRNVKLAYLLAWYSWNTPDGRVRMTVYEMGGGKEFYKNDKGYLDKAATRALLYS